MQRLEQTRLHPANKALLTQFAMNFFSRGTQKYRPAKVISQILWLLGPVVRRAGPYANIARLEERVDGPPQWMLKRGWTLTIYLKGREQALAIYHVDDPVRYDDLVSELEARTRLRVARRPDAASAAR